MQNEKSLCVAIIGCGWAGARHARAFAQAGARVAWAVDVDLARAEGLYASIGRRTQISTDYREALADPRVEAVSICLPHNLHGEVAVDCAGAGKHILVEKPIAARLEEADRIIAAAKAAGVTLMVAENELFRPLYRKVKALLEEGAIGRPALIQMTRQCYLTRSFLEERRWFLSAEAAAGGMMMSGGVHDFSTARMLLGEVESVYALRAPQRFLEMEGDDTSVAVVRFRSGVVGTFVQSFVMKSLVTAAGPEIHSLRLDGELGSLVVESAQENHLRLFSEREEYLPSGELIEHTIYVPEEDTFRLEVEHFLHCARTGAEPVPNGASMRRSLEVVLAAYRSMESGAPVKLAGYDE
jgi:predicted dehydrogenase